MRQFLVLTVITALTACSAMAATDEVTARRTCINKWHSMSDAEMGSTRREDFVYKCEQAFSTASSSGSALITMKPAAGGSMAMKPAASSSMAMKADSSGSAKCKDGIMVTYKQRQGTCSGHGGIDPDYKR